MAAGLTFRCLLDAIVMNFVDSATCVVVRLCEQPSSSLLSYYTRVKHLIDLCVDGNLGVNFATTRFWMGLYGGMSAKPCMLFGTALLT